MTDPQDYGRIHTDGSRSGGQPIGSAQGVAVEQCDPTELLADNLVELDLAKRAIRLAFKAGEEKARYDLGKKTRPLLEPLSDSAPAGCHCKDRCAAPVVMGRQQPCRDPKRFAPALTAELAEAKAEIATLREANGILEDALQEVGDDYPGSSCQEWCQQQVKLARQALEGQQP